MATTHRPTWRLARAPRVLYGLTIFALALSGFAQMPIFKRYGLASIPGLGWLAEFYTTHQVHYIAALILLLFLGAVVAHYLRRLRVIFRVTPSGWLRGSALAVVIATGMLRVLKNHPGVRFGPDVLTSVDLLHITGVILLGIFALGTAVARRGAYLTPR